MIDILDLFNMPVRLQLPTYSGDRIRAKGNSGDVVIKVEDTDNRRKEATHNDELWLQRSGKARYQH